MRILQGFLAASLLLGCEKDNDGAEPDPTVDGAVADAASESDAAVVDDAAPPVDAAPASDAAPPPPDAGPTPCETACGRFADCSVEVCPGFEADAHAGLVEGCAAACTANPAFATVINGAATCQTVVDFGRDSNADYAAACRLGEDPLEPDGSECPWACQGAEVCNQSQCVRPDGTCETEYHCRFGQECQGGRCVTGVFAECRAEVDCSGEGQTCRSFSQNPLDPGNCFVGCEDDEQCPTNQACMPDFGNICYFVFCGGDTPNGEVYGQCQIGPWGGTCYPIAEGNASPQGTAGVCLESPGQVPIGGPCDAQATDRTPEDQALQCAPGGLCFGDPDDPREPGAALDGQGQCTALCDPREPMCAEGSTCIDFTSPDDPATDFDETTFVGACLPSDCDVLAQENPCGDNRACRPYAVSTTAGLCADVGMAQRGEACEDSDDCAGVAICGNNGQLENACLPICDPSAEAPCLIGDTCFAQPGWVIGFCVPAQQ